VSIKLKKGGKGRGANCNLPSGFGTSKRFRQRVLEEKKQKVRVL